MYVGLIGNLIVLPLNEKKFILKIDQESKAFLEVAIEDAFWSTSTSFQIFPDKRVRLHQHHDHGTY